MKLSPKLLTVLCLALLAACLGLGLWVYQLKNPPKPAPKVYIDPENFDYSGTGLSDEVFKLEDPLQEPPQGDPVKEMEEMSLLPKPKPLKPSTPEPEPASVPQ